MVPRIAKMPKTTVVMVSVEMGILVAWAIKLELAVRLGNGGMICVGRNK